MDTYELTGELNLLRKLQSHAHEVVFDVGSNTGSWCDLVLTCLPHAHVHTFELSDQTHALFMRSHTDFSRITCNSFGLSDCTTWVKYKHCSDNHKLSTQLELMSPGTLAHVNYSWQQGLVVQGDAYTTSRRIDTIHLLKVDVEGHEPQVLQGLSHMLSEHKVNVIQFEYGTANIVSKFLLMDYYKLLEPWGYVLGKLSPQGVSFKPYSLTDEDFRGPNCVAVHTSQTQIIQDLRVT